MIAREGLLITSVIQEIKALVDTGDLSLSTRLLLDLMTDSDLDKGDFEKAVKIRVRFNNLESQNPPPAKEEYDRLKEDLLEFLHRLSMLFSKHEEPKEVLAKVQPQYLTQVEGKEPIVTVRGLYKQYPSVNFQMGPIDMDLKEGQITGLVGENGNGKTTLLRMIAGDVEKTGGELRYAFENKHELVLQWYSLKNQIAYIPQYLKRWHGKLKDNLHFAAANHGIFGKENAQIVDFVIHRLGLTKYMNSSWRDISGGYKLRFELAKVLVWRPKLLILDEPLAYLDINTKLLFMQDLRMLTRIKKFPLSIIMSSQQLHEIESVVDNIIFLEEGKPIYNGLIKEFGVDRLVNSFELSGEFGREELQNYLASYSITQISDTGQTLLIDTPIEIDSNKFLEIVSKKGKISYFRDISTSTRKLFKK